MKLIHTALAAEARPLIDHWKLKQQRSSRGGTVYSDMARKYLLLVSGTGALAAASSVAAVMAAEPEVDFAMNLGVCGCPWSSPPRGTPFLIHRIKDVSSQRTYYPDILARHPWKEASLETHGRAVTQADQPDSLVDMEASGFFHAARSWLAPHRIAVLKIVSDYLEGSSLSKDVIVKWVQEQIENIDCFLTSLPELNPELPSLPDNLHFLADQIQSRWELTATQGHLLNTSIENAFIRGRTDWALLEVDSLEAPSKYARNQSFRALINELESTI